MGAREADFAGTPVEAWAWSEETEVSSIQQFDIGIMPLQDSPWERGKCGYKLIQYMSCGLPVVASPVGVNKEIVIEGRNGYLADTLDDWREKLEMLLKMPPNIRAEVGKSGRETVETRYSLKSQAPRFLKAVASAVR